MIQTVAQKEALAKQKAAEEFEALRATLNGWDRFRYDVYDVIDNEETSNWASQLFESIIVVLILLSLAATVAESYAAVRAEYGYYFDVFENVTLVLFSIEFLLRLWTADMKFYKLGGSKGFKRWSFIKSGTGIVDFTAIFPLLIEIFVPRFFVIDLRFIRMLKVTRMLRVLKLSSFTSSIIVVGDVFYEKRSELGMTLFTTFVVMLVSSTVMYYLEYEAQPEKFTDIISTMWWAVATLTTVGYGDIYPVTGWGQFAGGIIAILGLAVVALPTGIIGAAFIEKLEAQQEEARLVREEARLAKEQEREAQERALLEERLAEQEADIIDAIEQAEQHNHPHPSNPNNKNFEQQLCATRFGAEFVYCPYCGVEMSKHK